MGGIKVGTGLSISNGVLNVDIDEIVSNKILEDNKKKYPVGKIIMSTTNTNPSTYLGFGTWELWGSGRVPVGVDTEQTEFNSSEKEGGEKTHKLSIDEMPRHTHNFNREGVATMTSGGRNELQQTLGSKSYNFISLENSGGDKAHNNLQPYITCYMWKRTA